MVGTRAPSSVPVNRAEEPAEAPDEPGALVVDRVSKGFGKSPGRVLAIKDLSLSIERGRFVTLIGPSGCGKTTLLRIVAGLISADGGDVSVFGETVEQAVEHKRIGFVPQSPALLPWRTVLDNVKLPLEVNRRSAERGEVRPVPLDPVAVLHSFGLGDVLDRRPAQLSGGMLQRVAIARAFVFDPAVLLMDEPFAAVDELTRETLRHELLSVWQANSKTVLFVTHSIAEAVALSDEVVVMSARPGRIQRIVPIGLPRPRDDQVESTASFHALEREIRLELRSRVQPR